MSLDHSIDLATLARRATLHVNESGAALFERAIARGEGRATAHGAFAVTTGKHTGRSAQDKFVVDGPQSHSVVWWGGNKPMSVDAFMALHDDVLAHVEGHVDGLTVQELYGGADPAYRLPVRVVTEFAWHGLFIRHLLRRPSESELQGFDDEFAREPGLTIINLPSFRADPERYGVRSETVIAVNLRRRLVIIVGTEYAGENKKSVFTALNHFLPEEHVMPMHCSANVGPEGSALFFGLSGTGKTTLSSDASRTLIGDDEHGWSDRGIFNFEGGCYAKTIRLSREAEPEIWDATRTPLSVLENVVIDADGVPDFDDTSLTENGRVAYPIHVIPNASEDGTAGHPKTIVMLTADAFGVLPPIARLTPAQAMYHFLSGYTAKVAGTEKGVQGAQATFSTCFGAPFMPREPHVYGDLLKAKIAEHGAACWLVNTGWTGGPYGPREQGGGERMPIRATRGLLNAALDGSLAEMEMRRDPNFGFEVPVALPAGLEGVDPAIMTPRETWADKAAYDRQAKRLVAMFVENFARFEDHVDAAVMDAAPQAA